MVLRMRSGSDLVRSDLTRNLRLSFSFWPGWFQVSQKLKLSLRFLIRSDLDHQIRPDLIRFDRQGGHIRDPF